MRCSKKRTEVFNDKNQIQDATVKLHGTGYITHARFDGQVNSKEKTISAKLSIDCCYTCSGKEKCASTSDSVSRSTQNKCTCPPFFSCRYSCVYRIPLPLATFSAEPSLAFRSLYSLQSPLDGLQSHLLQQRFLILMIVSTTHAPRPA